MAPVLGHAYTPFLGFNGGKALAVTFGVWTGLAPWQAPVVLGLAFLVWLKTLRVEGWAVVAGMATLLVYLLLFDRDPVLLAVWLVNTAGLRGQAPRRLAPPSRPGQRLAGAIHTLKRFRKSPQHA